MRVFRSDSSDIYEELVGGELAVAVSRDELVTMANAINEALEAVGDWECETRMGVTSVQARELQDQLLDILRDSSPPN